MKYIVLIVGLLFFGGCAYKSQVAKYKKEFTQPTSSYLETIVRNIKKKIPYKIGSLTIKEISSNYTRISMTCFINYNLEVKSSFDMGFNEGFIESVKKSMCSDAKLRVLFYKNATMYLKIYGKDGFPIDVNIDNYECEKLGYMVE